MWERTAIAKLIPESKALKIGTIEIHFSLWHTPIELPASSLRPFLRSTRWKEKNTPKTKFRSRRRAQKRKRNFFFHTKKAPRKKKIRSFGWSWKSLTPREFHIFGWCVFRCRHKEMKQAYECSFWSKSSRSLGRQGRSRTQLRDNYWAFEERFLPPKLLFD